MAAFTIDISNPFSYGFTGGLGGPRQGGHQPPHWYIEFGMDLGAEDGADVYAAFDGHITRLSPHVPDEDSGKVYGAQLFIRAHNDMMGGFYTHLTDLAPELALGSLVSRGDRLGRAFAFDGIPPHLHLALVEIVGGLPGGRYQGIDLYGFFVESANSDAVVAVTFLQDGSPPVVAG
jgi:hypothetical protein